MDKELKYKIKEKKHELRLVKDVESETTLKLDISSLYNVNSLKSKTYNVNKEFVKTNYYNKIFNNKEYFDEYYKYYLININFNIQNNLTINPINQEEIYNNIYNFYKEIWGKTDKFDNTKIIYSESYFKKTNFKGFSYHIIRENEDYVIINPKNNFFNQVTLCHEMGHVYSFDNSNIINAYNMMASFLIEVPAYYNVLIMLDYFEGKTDVNNIIASKSDHLKVYSSYFHDRSNTYSSKITLSMLVSMYLYRLYKINKKDGLEVYNNFLKLLKEKSDKEILEYLKINPEELNHSYKKYIKEI